MDLTLRHLAELSGIGMNYLSISVVGFRRFVELWNLTSELIWQHKELVFSSSCVSGICYIT